MLKSALFKTIFSFLQITTNKKMLVLLTSSTIDKITLTLNNQPKPISFK